MNLALAEYYRRNFEAFCRRQLKISTRKPGELIPLELNGAQQILLRRIEEQRQRLGYIRYCCCKSRQSTMSTFAQALCFHSTVLTQQFNSLLIANDDQTAMDIFKMSQRFLTHLSEDIRPMTAQSNVREIVFANPDKRKRYDDPGLGSQIVFLSATKITAGTGSTRHACHLSELSKWNHDSLELIFSSILPAIHLEPGTIIAKESTAFVGGDSFREMCEDARRGQSDDLWFFIPWFCDTKNVLPLDPGETIRLTMEEKRIEKLAAKGQPKDDVMPVTMIPEQFKWRRKKILELKSETMWEQEYPARFEDAWIRLDATIFDHGLLAQFKRDLKKPKRFVSIEPGPKIVTIRLGDGRTDVNTGSDYVAIWQEPEKGVTYDIGCDVSVGTQERSDWSVAQVLRRDTREQVAELHLHIDPKDLGTRLYWLGMYYNQAQLIVEMNGPGFATHGQLASLAYPYIYIWRHRERDVPSLSTYRGWKTMHDSKQLMVSNAMHRFNHKDAIVRSRVLWQEMYDYVQIAPGVYRASLGHDDAVEAWMICIQGGEDESFGNDAVVAQTQSNDFERQVARDRALQDDFSAYANKRLERIVREQRGIC